jgi:hypothetical protein
MADHVGVYEISGKNMSMPTVESAPKRSINTAYGARFSVLTSSNTTAYVSGAGGLTGVSIRLDYGYAHGGVTAPTSMSSYTNLGAVIDTGSVDYNPAFVTTPVAPARYETVRFGAAFSGTEAIESGTNYAYVSGGVPYIPSMSGRLNSFVGPFGYTPAIPWTEARRNVYVASSRGLRYFWHNGYGLTGSRSTYGHTEGATTSSIRSDFAVYVRISGKLSSTLSASSIVDPSWFLNGATGSWKQGDCVAFIPLSSATLGNSNAEQIDAAASLEVYNQTIGIKKLIDQSNDTIAFLNRQGYSKTTEERWTEVNQTLTTSSQ